MQTPSFAQHTVDSKCWSKSFPKSTLRSFTAWPVSWPMQQLGAQQGVSWGQLWEPPLLSLGLLPLHQLLVPLSRPAAPSWEWKVFKSNLNMISKFVLLQHSLVEIYLTMQQVFSWAPDLARFSKQTPAQALGRHQIYSIIVVIYIYTYVYIYTYIVYMY